MPGPVGRRGTGPLSRTTTFQLLPYRVEVTADRSLKAVVDGLANTARQPVEPRATLRYEVTGGGPFVVREEGDRLATLTGPGQVASLVARRCLARLSDYLSLGGWAAFHAGIVGVESRRALVLGGDGPVRTALLRRLAERGHRVEGDEVVFARGGEAVCLPCPDAAGFDKNLVLAPVDVAFVVSTDGSPGGCSAISAGALVRTAVASAFRWRGSWADLVRSCSTLVGAADGFALTAGEATATADLLAAACS